MNDVVTNVVCSIILGLTYRYLYSLVALVIGFVRGLL